jgi:hypothetical protein
MKLLELTPLPQRFDAPIIVNDIGGLLAALYKKLHNRKDLTDVVLRLESPDDGDAQIMIVEQKPGDLEVILATHTVRGIDGDGITHFVLNGEVMEAPAYAMALARQSGLSESEIAKL